MYVYIHMYTYMYIYIYHKLALNIVDPHLCNWVDSFACFCTAICYDSGMYIYTCMIQRSFVQVCADHGPTNQLHT